MVKKGKRGSNVFWRDFTEFGQGAAQVCYYAQFGDHHPVLPDKGKTHLNIHVSLISKKYESSETYLSGSRLRV